MVIGMMAHTTLSAQITVAPDYRKQDSPPAVYDSLSNSVGKNTELLIGQCLYFLPLPEYIRSSGYMGFYADSELKIAFKPKGNRKNSPFSENSAIENKYFDVVDIGKHIEYSIETIYLKLKERESGSVLYYTQKSMSDYIIVGYFEKIRQISINKIFISRGRNWRIEKSDLVDINTGRSVHYEAGTTWRCVDVALDLNSKYVIDHVSLVIENNREERVLLDYITSGKEAYFYTERRAAQIKEQYGEDLYTLILRGSIRIGMSQEVATLSWGYPSEVNKTSTVGGINEQWVYGDGQYLYFENGKVTAIQN